MTAAHRDLVRAEGKLDELILRHADADGFSLEVARATPGDIVGNPFAEAARSTLATAEQIAQAAAERARLRDQLARWARSHTGAEARDAAASLAASDQALARLTALDVQRLQAALEPPLAGYLRDVQQLVEHAGARLVVLILPIDVQVSPAEWRKYGTEGIAMDASLALTTELVTLCRFLAFVHRGERRGREQFERYARHFDRRGDTRTRALFDAILVDERRHERYTRALLVELAGGERAARAALRRAALWEAWRTWRRAGRALASAIYAVAMIAIYLVAGLVAAIAARATTARRARPHAAWQLPPAPARAPAAAATPAIREVS